MRTCRYFQRCFKELSLYMYPPSCHDIMKLYYVIQVASWTSWTPWSSWSLASNLLQEERHRICCSGSCGGENKVLRSASTPGSTDARQLFVSRPKTSCRYLNTCVNVCMYQAMSVWRYTCTSSVVLMCQTGILWAYLYIHNTHMPMGWFQAP